MEKEEGRKQPKYHLHLRSHKTNGENTMTKEELEEIKEIGRAVDALKKDTARIEREVNEIFKRIDPILEKE